MHLSLATREDAMALVDLFVMTGLSTPATMDEATAQARWDAMHQALPGVQVIVGRRCDGTVMGALTLVLLPLTAHGSAPSALLEDVAVHPVMQREGLGRQLVECAMEVAREAGRYKLVLSSNQQRAGAQAFFERLGFDRQGLSLEVSLIEAQV
ncbi:MAG TPA: GNAT family N-acetyltransferase [Rhizobacter sp.]|nr:GNAT family N-acetyltransferase [Rhizobacter sp.]